jgi:hypothetical protein
MLYYHVVLSKYTKGESEIQADFVMSALGELVSGIER